MTVVLTKWTCFSYCPIHVGPWLVQVWAEIRHNDLYSVITASGASNDNCFYVYLPKRHCNTLGRLYM